MSEDKISGEGSPTQQLIKAIDELVEFVEARDSEYLADDDYGRPIPESLLLQPLDEKDLDQLADLEARVIAYAKQFGVSLPPAPNEEGYTETGVYFTIEQNTKCSAISIPDNWKVKMRSLRTQAETLVSLTSHVLNDTEETPTEPLGNEVDSGPIPESKIPQSDPATTKPTWNEGCTCFDTDQQESTPEELITVDLGNNRVTIRGKEFKVEPHHARMLHALKEASKDSDWLVTGKQLNELPSCHGKHFSREFKKLKKKVPPLVDLIFSSSGKGYRLDP